MKKSNPFITICFTLLIASCATPPQDSDSAYPGSTESSSDIQQHLANLLNNAESSQTPDREEYLLMASDILLLQGEYLYADRLLEEINLNSLNQDLRARIQIMRARLAFQMEDFDGSVLLLSNNLLSPVAMLPNDLQLQIQQLKSDSYGANGQLLSAAKELIALEHLLPIESRQDNHERIWQILRQLPVPELQSLSRREINFELQGWYQLSVIGLTYRYSLDQQLVALENWQQQWSRHPAALQLPVELALIESMARERPQQVALLLPLNSTAGKVIRDGFLTAYFNVKTIGGQVPEILLYDTSGDVDIQNIYQQAILDGAQFVIGPLLKQHVSTLQKAKLDVPVLALNTSDLDAAPNPLLYQFSLSPEDEAIQIAAKAWQDGHRNAAILSPRDVQGSDYYFRKRAAFVNQWLSMGGEISTEQIYALDYTSSIESLLNLDASTQRKESIEDLIGRSVEFTQRRRQDIDMIFLIAQPGAARQIVPRFGYLYAGDIPVYASQDIFSGLSRPIEDADLNGIYFSDSPWLINSEDELKISAENAFPQPSAANLRLQAFGVDAFRLYPRLKQLKETENIAIYGATGKLSMTKNNAIFRELSWAQFQQGIASPLNLQKSVMDGINDYDNTSKSDSTERKPF